MSDEYAPHVIRVVVDALALKRAIAYNRMTYRSVALRAGLSHGLIGDMASGRRTTTTQETATKIERALGVDPHVIFTIS